MNWLFDFGQLCKNWGGRNRENQTKKQQLKQQVWYGILVDQTGFFLIMMILFVVVVELPKKHKENYSLGGQHSFTKKTMIYLLFVCMLSLLQKN